MMAVQICEFDGQDSQKSFLNWLFVGEVRCDQGRVDYDQSRKLVYGLVDESFTQWHFLVELYCTFQWGIPFLLFNEDVELFFLLCVYTLLKQISTQKIIRKEFNRGLGVWLGRGDHSTEGLLTFIFSPEQQFDYPIESLSLHEVERNVFSVAFDDGWRVVYVDVIQLLCVDPHNLKSFWLLTQGLNSCQRPLDFISI